MHNIGSYQQQLENFDWRKIRQELELTEGKKFNLASYCSDRICQQGRGDKIAMIWEGFKGEIEKYTFDQLRINSNTYAALLEKLGVAPGERVFIFMDKIPDLYFAFLGILKRGAIVAPLFNAFGQESLLTRLENGQATAIITTKKLLGKVRTIKDKVPSLKHVVVANYSEQNKLKEKELAFSLKETEPQEAYQAYQADLETPSILHYTSGTTGQPKGAQHVHGSIISQYITAKWVLDLKDDDIYWCTADPGWVTGTSYGIIGPWSLGATQIIFDAGFSSEKWYSVLERHGVTVWYSAPTAIRLLMKDGVDVVKKFNLKKLRHLASVGEPLNAEAVIWGREAFGKDFHDTYWQTETGCMVITNYPGMEVRPGSMGKPFPGIEAAVLNKDFQPIKEVGKPGLIALKPGWPSMFRSYWNNKEVYDSKFSNGWYICGDRARIDKDGYYWFQGRDDDVINTGGHLVSPFEIESALLEHEAIAESAAIGKPDPVNMEVVKAFITVKPGFKVDGDLELEIMNFVRKRLSPLAMPQEIEFVEKLPKTRSGKIMRRMLRAQETGQEIGDTSTLEN